MQFSSSKNGSEAVASRLDREIKNGKIQPNEAVPSERVLADRWGYSRTVIREGIGMLVAKGVLTRIQGRGTFVNDLDLQAGNEVWAEMARRHPDIQGDLLDFRMTLERRSAELAAEHHDAEDRQRLEEAESAVYQAFEGSNREQQMLADLAFHHTIAEATHNPVYAYLMRSMHKVLYDHMRLTLIGNETDAELRLQLQMQHRSLLRAILARDASLAAQIITGHLDFVGVRLNHLRPHAVSLRS